MGERGGRLPVERAAWLDTHLTGWRDATRPDVPASQHVIGARDGHGRYGILDTDDGRLICHECGRSWLHLGTHAVHAHGMTAESYRVAHGLGFSVPLVADQVRERLSASWHANAAVHLEALSAARRPHAATAASRGRGWAPATRALRQEQARARRGRDLTADESVWLAEVAVDLAAWCARARILLAGDDVTITSLARAADITAGSAYQRLRRYPG